MPVKTRRATDEENPGYATMKTAASSVEAPPRRRPAAVIAVAQLLGTSLWFSANGAGPDLAAAWNVSASHIGWLTGAVQAGFIAGTLLLAVFGLADRYPASRVFALSTVLGACSTDSSRSPLTGWARRWPIDSWWAFRLPASIRSA